MMNQSKLFVSLLTVVTAICFFTAPAFSHDYPKMGKTLQVLAAFDNPEGVIFSADGKYLFVTNSAEVGRPDKGFGWGHNAGYISKLEVLPSGLLKMIEPRLITGLTGPLGCAVSTVATKTFPAGTIFCPTGSAPTRVPGTGEPVKDPAQLKTKIIGFNTDGKILGEIPVGPGSAAAKVSGAPVLLANATAFDKTGNLFLVDTAFGGDLFEPKFEGKGGTYLFPVESLDDLAQGKEPSKPIQFLAMPGNPDGVEVSPVDGKIYVNTVGPVAGAPDPADGGIYALTYEDFKTGKLPAPIVTGQGALDGLDFTDGGTQLNTQIKGGASNPIGVLVVTSDNKTHVLRMNAFENLTGPADIDILKMKDGSSLLVIPELFATDVTAGDDEVTVVKLPADFDKP